MSATIRDPFEDFLFSHLADYTATQMPAGVKMSARIWKEQVARAHAAWHGVHDQKPVKRTVKPADDEWIDELQADPAFAGVDVRKELGKARFWCRENSRQCTRKFFVNWLNKADRAVVANSAPTRSGPAISPEPVGWITVMRTLAPDWRRFREEKEFGSSIPSWPCLGADERTYILGQIK